MPETAAAATGAVHLNILLLAGIAIAGGTIGAGLFRRIRVPQVVGYVFIGLVIGRSWLNIIDEKTLDALAQFNFVALGFIGFKIGGELKISIFRRYGKQFAAILFAEGVTAAVVAGGATFAAAYLGGQGLAASAAMGLILGSIASATAPAATVNVLWEYRSRGILTTTTLAVVALDDALAVSLFAVAVPIAGALLGKDVALSGMILEPLREIGLAIAIGAAFGATLAALLRKVAEKETELLLVVGTVLLVIGLALLAGADPIIAAMVLGLVLVNLAPAPAAEAFALVDRFAMPIFVLFFVMAGSRLKITHLERWMWIVVGAYVIGRITGKFAGAALGATVSGAAGVLRKYLGFCLASQAGVAVGLAILAGMRLDEPTGELVIAVITTTVFFFEIAGPPLVRFGIVKAGEAGRNVTEEDLIRARAVGDAMDASPPTFHQNTHLPEILHAFSQHDVNAFPVVDDDERLAGLITIDEIRESLATESLEQWLLAVDMMGPVHFRLRPDMPLHEGLESMRKAGVETAPVVFREDETRLAGMIDRAAVERGITAELLRRHAAAGQEV